MKTWRKGSALLLVGMMLMSGLVAFSAPAVVADESGPATGEQMGWTIIWNDVTMCDDPTLNPAEESIIFNYDNRTQPTLYYLGDDEADIMFEIQPSHLDSESGSWVNFTLLDGDDSDIVQPGDVDFISYNPNYSGVDPVGVPFPNFNYWNISDSDILRFTIKIDNAGDVETTYPLTIQIEYRSEGMTLPAPTTYIDTIGIDVYVSSVFHDTDSTFPANDDCIDTPFNFEYTDGGWTDVYVMDAEDDDDWDDGTPRAFEAGDEFAQAWIRADAECWFNLVDPIFTITAPTDDGNGDDLPDITMVNTVTQFYGDYNGPFRWGDEIEYRLNVQAQTPPGITQGTFQIEFTRDDKGYDQAIMENARPIDFIVDFSYRDTDPYHAEDGIYDELKSPYQVVVTGAEIRIAGEEEPIPEPEPDTNSTTNTTGNGTRSGENYVHHYDPLPVLEQPATDQHIMIDVEIMNNGNTPIYQMIICCDPDVGTDWIYFEPVLFFYHAVGGVSYDSNMLLIPELGVGERDTFTMELIVAKGVPLGEHRLPLFYGGYWFNDGSLYEQTVYEEMYTYGWLPDNTAFITTVAIEVTDEIVQCHVEDVNNNADDKTDIRANTIDLDLYNDEAYAFIDVTVQADFTGTPWSNPLDGTALVWANDVNPANPEDDWEATSATPTVIDCVFDVDTDPDMAPGRYAFSLIITATNALSLEVITTTIGALQGVVADFEGYGPRIQISALTNDDIVPGQEFGMNLTIENVGDDALRDAYIIIDTDGTHFQDWFPICDFIGQIQRQNESYMDGEVYNFNGTGWWGENYTEAYDWEYSDSNEWAGAEVTLEQLDIDSAREIIELNLYMDGVYSSPSARISLVRIIDLAPGASTIVDYTMLADKDMVNGKSYEIEVWIYGIDSQGSGNYVDGESLDISVMSSLPGESYNPVELNWFDAGLKALALFLFFIIVLAILLFVYNMFKGEPYDDEDEDFDFEDDEPENMPEQPTEAAEQELVEP